MNRRQLTRASTMVKDLISAGELSFKHKACTLERFLDVIDSIRANDMRVQLDQDLTYRAELNSIEELGLATFDVEDQHRRPKLLDRVAQKTYDSYYRP